MKLFFIDGRKNGEEMSISPPGVSIGRELDNDVVLQEEGSSRYHAKIETDGTEWKLKDLGTTNGTKLNGEKIPPDEPSPLKKGDRIAIGKQTMVFAETKPSDSEIAAPPPLSPPAAAAAPPSPIAETVRSAEPVADSAEGSASTFSNFFEKKDDSNQNSKPADSFANTDDFFGNTAQNMQNQQSEETKKHHAGILFYVGVLATAVILVSLFIAFENSKKKTTDAKHETTKKRIGAPLLVRYEKQVTTISPRYNIFRYVLEIKNGKVTITRDDLRAHLKDKLSRSVSEDQLDDLEDALKETDFMITEQPQRGTARATEDRFQKLSIAYGQEMNNITIENTTLPLSFVEASNVLDDFSRNVLDIPPVSLTPEEMKKEGLTAYRKGKQLFDNYQAKPENLNESIKRFQIAIENLKSFSPPLKEYESAITLRDKANQMLKELIRKHSNKARRHYRMKEYRDAKNEFLSIMEATDSNSKQYKSAKKYIIQLEKDIKRQRKKR
ncbi:MAG: FHA domain-containing protein [Kiritimatiellaeota bacterium]|nr:FHA domain-containing protein [Kiritimatiellota bacterium]